MQLQDVCAATLANRDLIPDLMAAAVQKKMTVVACVLGLLIAALGLIGLRQSTDRPRLHT